MKRFKKQILLALGIFTPLTLTTPKVNASSFGAEMDKNGVEELRKDIASLAGQAPVVVKAKMSVSNFKPKFFSGFIWPHYISTKITNYCSCFFNKLTV